MDLFNNPNIVPYLLFVIMLLGGMSPSALAISIVASIGVVNATSEIQFEIILFGYILSYLLAQFRD